MVELDYDAAQTWIYPVNYPVRDYQLNITHAALFSNTLVSLPTGLGKTLIAAVVMYNFHRWYPCGKVIFMAPTRPLVTQQRSACQGVTGMRDDECAQLEGSVPAATREVMWREKRVFFCTPQVVENDLAQGRLDRRQIVCIVIDEAHRAIGSYAFVNVIREISSVHKAFRVVALSATPGPNQSAVQKVILNLLIAHMEWRTEDDPDVAEYSHAKDVEIVKCPRSEASSSIDTMKKHIDNLIVSCCHRLVQGQYLMSSQPSAVNMLVIDEAERCKSISRYFVCYSYRKCISRGDARMASIVKSVRSLEKCRLLIKAGKASELVTHVTDQLTITTPANEVTLLFCELLSLAMQGERMMVSNSNYHSFLSLLENFSSASTLLTHNCKITKLREILCQYFEATEQNNSRVIVFVALRNTVHQVISEISSVAGVVARPFIGQANSADNRGMSQKEQEEIVVMFRQGICNVLVATSIAEEGLDIGEVDLIVCFDNVASPVRLVQRLGRTGRKRKGRVIMLVSEDKDEDKVQLSSKRIGAMSNNVEKMKKSLVYYRHNCRMIPEDINPRLVEKYFDVSCIDKPPRHSGAPSRPSAIVNTIDRYTTRKPNDGGALGADDLYDWLFEPTTAIDATSDATPISKISPNSVVDMHTSLPAKRTCSLCEARYSVCEESEPDTCATCSAALKESLAMQEVVDVEQSVVKEMDMPSPSISIEAPTSSPTTTAKHNSPLRSDVLDVSSLTCVPVYARLKNTIKRARISSCEILSTEEQQSLFRHLFERTPVAQSILEYHKNTSHSNIDTKTIKAAKTPTNASLNRTTTNRGSPDVLKSKKLEVVGSEGEYLLLSHSESMKSKVYRVNKRVFSVAEEPRGMRQSDDIIVSAPVLSTTCSTDGGRPSSLQLGSEDISPIRCSNSTIYEANAFDISMLEENFWSGSVAVHASKGNGTTAPASATKRKPATAYTPQPQNLVKISKPAVDLVSPALADVTQREVNRSNIVATHGDDDVPCSVCTSREVEEDDPGVFCDICNGYTHLDCYGLTLVPKGNFHCDSCKEVTHPPCVLCFQRSGMLRQCTSGQWAHPVCGLFTPELVLNDEMRITSLALDPEREQLRCFLCSKKGGAVVQCSYMSCFTAMHPYCALSHDYQLVIRFVNGVFSYEVYCNAHKYAVGDKGLFSATCDLNISTENLIDDIEEDNGELNLDMTQVVSPLRPRQRLKKLKYSTKFTARRRTKKNHTKSATTATTTAKAYFEEEAMLSGSASSDEAPDECSQLSGSFINDGAYTQIAGCDTGMAMYHGLHRKLVADSPLTGRFRFRGGEKGLPLTERLMQQYGLDHSDGSFADGAGDQSFESNHTPLKILSDDHDLYSF